MSETTGAGSGAGARGASPIPGSPFLWRVASVGTLGAGMWLLASGGRSPSLAILLLIAGLAAAGVLLGSGRYGPDVEGRLDLSARLGLGVLGGFLGGLLAIVAHGLLLELGAARALGVDLAAGWGAGDLLGHLGSAALWGMVLGILFPRLPGRTPGGRGAAFGLVPSLYMLVWAYPVELDAGFFGVGNGALTFLFVLALNLVWGATAGATIGWGEVAQEAPVSRPLGSEA